MKITATIISFILLLLLAVAFPSIAQERESSGVKTDSTSAASQEDVDDNDHTPDANLRKVAGGRGELDLDLDIHIDQEAIESSVRLAMKELENMEVHLENMELELENLEIDIPEIEIEIEPFEVEIPAFDVEIEGIQIDIPEVDFDEEEEQEEEQEEEDPSNQWPNPNSDDSAED